MSSNPSSVHSHSVAVYTLTEIVSQTSYAPQLLPDNHLHIYTVLYLNNLFLVIVSL